VTITTFEPTPTQLRALERRRAFRESIEVKAASQKPAVERSSGIKGYQVAAVPKEAVATNPFQKFVAAMVWPAIPLAGADPTIAQIQKEVVARYGLKLSDMHSRRQNWEIARPRQVAMYLAKTMTKHSLPEIGRRFGGRDHTTVLHGVRRVAKLMQTDPKIANDIESILIKLTAASHVGSPYIHRDALVAEENGYASDTQEDAHQRGPDPSSSDHRP
jgi:hypothetical protein